jgi:hypothetical protein
VSLLVFTRETGAACRQVLLHTTRYGASSHLAPPTDYFSPLMSNYHNFQVPQPTIIVRKAAPSLNVPCTVQYVT